MGRTTGKGFTEKQMFDQLNCWLMEALSPSNDGWTQKHYMDILREFQTLLNESLPAKEVKFEDTPDDEMCF